MTSRGSLRDSLRRLSSSQSVQSSSQSRVRLSTSIEPRILRGVRSDDLLCQFGFHLGGLAGGRYELSEPVDRLDDFISHDWLTGRWPKFLALCIVYNALPAYVASALTGVVTSILQCSTSRKWGIGVTTNTYTISSGKAYTLERSCFGVFVCPVVFIIVFVFWQRIRGLCGRRLPMCFLDKHCIHQSDVALKTLGVYSLAGFLSSSDRLVVLWSNRYFTRLWCTFELAAWKQVGKNLKDSVIFLPVQSVIMCLSAFLLCFFNITYWHCRMAIPGIPALGARSSQIIDLAIATCVFSFGMICTAHIFRRLLEDLQQLPGQMGSFDIRSAECFCCANNHIHPVTGETLTICDRGVVYSTLKEWYADPSDADDGAHLDTFNTWVQTTFRKSVLKSLGRNEMRYSTSLMLTAPLLWEFLDCLPEIVRVGEVRYFVRKVVEHGVVALVVFPCAYPLILKMYVYMHQIIGRPFQHWAGDLAISVLFGLAAVVVAMCLWLPFLFSGAIVSVVPQVVVSLAALLLAAFLFWPTKGKPSKGSLDMARGTTTSINGRGDIRKESMQSGGDKSTFDSFAIELTTA